MLFQDGANDGFHEAIGDTVTLSVTPAYLRKIGLLGDVQPSQGSHHQPADEDGARQGRVPAVRQADRRVALGRVLRRRSSPPTTTRPGGSCARSTRACRAPVPRSEEDFDPGAKYHIPGEHAVHALLPVVHPAVPVPQGAVQGRRLQGPAATSARSTATRRPARSYGAMLALGREPALAGHAGGADRHARRWTRRRSSSTSSRCEAWLEEQNKGQTCGWD